MVTVAVIGAGQIGSRHLQALARSAQVERIEVVGRSSGSLKIAEERYLAITPAISQSVRFSDELSHLSDSIDVAIIATNSDVRFSVLKELLSIKRVGALLLEKVVFQTSREFESAIEALTASGVPAWVNCFRRTLPFYRRLRTLFGTERALTVSVKGGEWGLGCNAVHYVDLFAFLTGGEDLSIDERCELDSAVLASRRPGFVEFTGRLSANCGQHRLDLMARAGSQEPAQICIVGSGTTVQIDETRSVAITYSTSSLEKRLEETFNLPLQSELTQGLVEEILDRGESALPTIKEAYAVHAPLLTHFTRHLELVTGDSYFRCPIT